MSILISAVCIFILLCATAALALVVPLEEKTNACKNIDIKSVEVDSVLTQLVKTSKNVPSVIWCLD